MTPSNPLQRIAPRAAAAALCSALGLAPALATPTIAITGSPGAVPGGSLQLAVTASGFADLVAFQFDIAFDAALFSATGVAEGGFLATAGSTFFDGGQIDNAAGTASFVLGTLIGPGPGASGGGTLATLQFGVSAQPTATSGLFRLVNVSAYDTALAPIDVVLQDHAVAVPEPATWAMALAGLAMLVPAGLRATQRAGRPTWPA